MRQVASVGRPSSSSRVTTKTSPSRSAGERGDHDVVADAQPVDEPLVGGAGPPGHLARARIEGGDVTAARDGGQGLVRAEMRLEAAGDIDIGLPQDASARGLYPHDADAGLVALDGCEVNPGAVDVQRPRMVSHVVQWRGPAGGERGGCREVLSGAACADEDAGQDGDRAGDTSHANVSREVSVLAWVVSHFAAFEACMTGRVTLMLPRLLTNGPRTSPQAVGKVSVLLPACFVRRHTRFGPVRASAEQNDARRLAGRATRRE